MSEREGLWKNNKKRGRDRRRKITQKKQRRKGKEEGRGEADSTVGVTAAIALVVSNITFFQALHDPISTCAGPSHHLSPHPPATRSSLFGQRVISSEHKVGLVPIKP